MMQEKEMQRHKEQELWRIDAKYNRDRRRQGVFAFAALIVIVFAIRGGIFSPTTHQLLPNIASDEERESPILELRYVKRTWWGMRSETHDFLKISKDKTPQYFDDKTSRWIDIPSEALGEKIEDDRVMEVDNRGYHEQ